MAGETKTKGLYSGGRVHAAGVPGKKNEGGRKIVWTRGVFRVSPRPLVDEASSPPRGDTSAAMQQERERVLLALHRTQRHGCPRRPARVRLVHLADTVTSRHPRAKSMDQPGWVSLRFRRVHEHDGYRIVLDFRRRWYVVRLRSSVFGLRGDREIERDRTRPREDGDRSPNLAQSDGYPYSRLHIRGRRLPLSPRPLFILQINPHLAPASRDRSACARERGSAKSSFRAGGTSASFRTQLDRRPSQGIFSTFIHDTCRIGPSRVTYATSELPG